MHRIALRRRRARKRRSVARPTRWSRRLSRSQSGQALVEFALVLPILVGLIIGIFEFGLLMYTRLTVRHAVMEATRFAVTGQVEMDPQTGEPVPRALSIRQIILQKAIGLDVDVGSISIDPPDGGGPEEIVTVSLQYTYEYAFPGFKNVFPDLELQIATTMRNEPFFD